MFNYGRKAEFVVEKDGEGGRADKFLANNLDGFSRERLKKVFDSGCVLVNGIAVKPSFKIKEKDKITAYLPDDEILDVKAENIELNIVYQDEDIAIIDKPAGMVVHPANGNTNGTMVNALMYHIDNLSAINGVVRPGIVHRIDKETSGLLVVAKNDEAHNALAAQFAVHSITRAYKAVVHGNFSALKGTVDAPIGRDLNDRKAFCVTLKNSKRAVTHYEVEKNYEGYSLLDVTLETGRTHQIRVHMKYISHPIVGDKVYGLNTELDKPYNGQLLHAYLLGFIHPRSQKYVEFRSELPARFDKLLR